MKSLILLLWDRMKMYLFEIFLIVLFQWNRILSNIFCDLNYVNIKDWDKQTSYQAGW